MHGLVILDEAHQVIRPSLIWCDQRSQAQVDFVNAKVGRENVLRYTANPVLTGFTLPKLLWVRDNEPQNFERVRQMLLPKDYVRFRLTGEFATEVSDASGTSVFDVVNRRWSFEMMDALGLDRAILPRVLRIERGHGRDHGGGRGADGLEGRNAGGGRRRRSGVERGGQRDRGRGDRVLHAGDERRGVRAHGEGGVRPGGARPHVLPRSARQVARDGRDAGRGAEPAVVPQSTGAGRGI